MSQREELVVALELEVIDWRRVGASLLELPGAQDVSLRGPAVSRLRRQLSTRMVHEGSGMRDRLSGRIRLQLSPEVISILAPLLSDSRSITEMAVSDGRGVIAEGFDWGAGCCPVRLWTGFNDVADQLVAERSALLHSDA